MVYFEFLQRILIFAFNLQGRVKFPIGGKVRELHGAEPLRLRHRQYSLDGRRLSHYEVWCTQERSAL